MNKFQMNGGEVKANHDGTMTETHKRKDGSTSVRVTRSIHPGREYMGKDYNPAKRRYFRTQPL